MLSLTSVFRSVVVHQSYRRGPSIAASTRLFSSCTPSQNEKNFAEVGEMLIEADASQTAAPETEAPKAQAFDGLTRGDNYDLQNVKLLGPGLFARPYDFARPPQTNPVRRKRPFLGPPAADSRRQDIFYQLGLDPLHECQNSTLLSRYVSEMGKIKSRAETGLTWKNQRRLGKAIRRAKMMGVIPVLSRRPLGLGYAGRDY